MDKAICYIDNVHYKAVIDEKRRLYSISGWPICKPEKRNSNKRVFYYSGLNADDLLSYMLRLAPFKKPRTMEIDDGISISIKIVKPWIWYKK